MEFGGTLVEWANLICSPWFYIPFAIGVAFLHRILESKFARVNLWLGVWILLTFAYLKSGYGLFCMCGYPYGMHHYIHTSFDAIIIPVLFFAIIFAYPAIYVNSHALFWFLAIAFSCKKSDGETWKCLWGRRIFYFVKFYALMFLISKIVPHFFTDFDDYWGHSDWLFAFLMISLFTVICASWEGRKRCWVAALFLCLGVGYYSSVIPHKRDRGINLEGTYSLPKVKFEYSPENDPRDYYSRKIEAEPVLKYGYYKFAGGWDFSKIKESKYSKPFFYSPTENPEIFENAYDNIMKALPVIDENKSTKDLQNYLSDKSDIRFLKMDHELKKEDALDLSYFMYITNSNDDGFYFIELELKLKGDK